MRRATITNERDTEGGTDLFDGVLVVKGGLIAVISSLEVVIGVWIEYDLM